MLRQEGPWGTGMRKLAPSTKGIGRGQSLPLPRQAPLPKPSGTQGATADIRRVSATHEAGISDVCKNYTFKFPG